MEQVVYNYYNIDKHDYLSEIYDEHIISFGTSLLPLWNAKYMIDVLEPSITFHISDEEEGYLQIKDINNTDITNTFTYYMQFKFLPELYKYLNKQKVICNEIITGFYDKNGPGDKTYEEVSAHLKKYLNIDSDPRELLSINGNGVSTKESWIDFLSKKIPHVMASQNDFNELRTWITKISCGIDYESMHEYLLGRASFTEYT